VLEGIHGPRVYVQIAITFYGNDFELGGKEMSDGSCSDSFAES